MFARSAKARFVFLNVAALLSIALLASVSWAQTQSQWAMTRSPIGLNNSVRLQSVQMVVNSSREITSEEAFKQVTIANPAVLNAIPLEGGNRLQINALATGITTIDLVGVDDTVHSIEVMVLGDVRELEAVFRQLFPDASISVMPVQTGCVISGNVSNPDHVEEIVRIAELYYPTVIPRIRVTGVYTIQLQVQIMEVSRTKLRELGIDWALTAGNTTIGQGVGGFIDSAFLAATGTQNFTFGIVESDATFFASLKALRRNNLVKVLATPKLVALDGRPASFNVGGEIPVLVPQGLGQTAVQFREFGTRLDYVAKIKDNGLIGLEIRPYVSEVDPSRSVLLNGVNVPGLRSRYLETSVEIGVGQTLALGGLLQMRTEAINSGVPVLSDMPYIGSFFRSTREEQNEIELLITVTPNFAGPMDPHEVPQSAPGTTTRSPNNKDLYMRGYIEVPVTGTGHQVVPGLITSPSFGGLPTGQQHTAPVAAPIEPSPDSVSFGPNAPRLAKPTGYFTGSGNASVVR